MQSETSQKSKIKLFSLVKKLSEFPVITLNSSREESKHLLLFKCLKQKINAKTLKLLVRTFIENTFLLLKLHLPKASIIIIGKNSDVPSVQKLSWDTLHRYRLPWEHPWFKSAYTISEGKQQCSIVRAKMCIKLVQC